MKFLYRSRVAIALLAVMVATLLIGGVSAETSASTEPRGDLDFEFASSIELAGAEIAAYHADSQRLFVTGGSLQIIDISQPLTPTLVTTIDPTTLGFNSDAITSVAVSADGTVAAALPDDNEQLPGNVLFFDTDGNLQSSVEVGALPDMLTFTPDGNKLLVANEGEQDDAVAAMATGENGFQTKALFTIGETLEDTAGQLNPTTAGAYTPPGILDGLGAIELDANTVRVFANHELLNFRGYDYSVSNGSGGTFTLDGARISYFDVNKTTHEIEDAGLAYDTIYDANGVVATDNSFLANNLIGFSRFCSSVLVEQHQFGAGIGLENPIYFAGEEDGGNFNPVGGAEWALDIATGNIWHVPDMGRGAWENITEVDTGTTTHVAFILADDSSPFNADADAEDEAAPLYLYVGEKDTTGDFLAQNGLRDGTLFVWVSDTGELTPLDYHTSGTLAGKWVAVDNSRDMSKASETGGMGYDEFGYPTQRNLWTQAEALGAFGFSRPEDVAFNPSNGSEIILASTGVDTYAVDATTGNGVDTFGTIYTVDTDFTNLSAPTASVTIVYDGDADATRALRSPDNLDWADDGKIYVQEDEAEEDTLSGDEVLFGAGAVNPKEAGIVQLDPTSGATMRVATIDRSVVLDPTTGERPFDTDLGRSGEWESSGILDVSSLFGEDAGTLFLFNVQAHGIEDQTDINVDSRINDNDLVEGGQLLFLHKGNISTNDPAGSISIIDVSGGVRGGLVVQSADFTQYDTQKETLKADGVRVFPGRSVSQDVEPEYIAVSPDSSTAFVTLQEANAIAVVDIASATVTDIQPLGLKDHSNIANQLDASDRDGGINIANWPVFGMYMPDAIAAFEDSGTTYYVTANEGDDRGENEDIADVMLDASAFPFSSTLQMEEQIGRLGISTIDGDIDGDGDYDMLYSYGARSFTIWDADGNLVWDSGDQFAEITAVQTPTLFNANNGDSADFDTRSDNKGMEPEGVTLGEIGGNRYAFIGLERAGGGVMIYDISDPSAPIFDQYIRRDEDVAPEGLVFIPADTSRAALDLLVVTNEVSNTLTIYKNGEGDPSAVALLSLDAVASNTAIGLSLLLVIIASSIILVVSRRRYDG